MNIGWIYPHRGHCGITKYSLDYIDELRKKINIIDIDPYWWKTQRQIFLSLIDKCDILHIQYDIAGFMDRDRDYYEPMSESIKKPLIVTLHEVYDEDPAVFPRSGIKGSFPLLQLKRLLWDIRHPVQRNFTRHMHNVFYANKIIVHHCYHTKILISKGIPESVLYVIPMPVKTISYLRNFVFHNLPEVNIVSCGFINPAFDYQLLFCVLEKMKRPWNFTWIGGVRNEEQTYLLNQIRAKAEECGWKERFLVTGWVEEDEMTRRLESSDVVLALFKYRSSSASISTAMGACKPVIATKLPIIKDMITYNGGNPPLLPVKADADSVVSSIERLVTDISLQKKLFEALSGYIRNVAIDKTAEKHIELYLESVQK